jgi:hypothetical protein
MQSDGVRVRVSVAKFVGVYKLWCTSKESRLPHFPEGRAKDTISAISRFLVRHTVV